MCVAYMHVRCRRRSSRASSGGWRCGPSVACCSRAWQPSRGGARRPVCMTRRRGRRHWGWTGAAWRRHGRGQRPESRVGRESMRGVGLRSHKARLASRNSVTARSVSMYLRTAPQPDVMVSLDLSCCCGLNSETYQPLGVMTVSCCLRYALVKLLLL